MPMFCPKCGQQNTETVRFCTRCGFRLSAVKQLLTTDGLPGDEAQPAALEALQPRRKDLNLGALLMYLGSLFSLFVGVFYGGGHEPGGLDALFALPAAIMWTFMVNAAAFVLVLLGARFSKRQKDLSLGAMLMFVFSMLANFAIPAFELGGVETVVQYGKAELLTLTVGLAALLWIGQPLMQRLLHGLFNLFAEESLPPKSSAKHVDAPVALPSAQSALAAPVVETDVKTGVTTSKMVPHAVGHSVTEASTQLLEKELD